MTKDERGELMAMTFGSPVLDEMARKNRVDEGAKRAIMRELGSDGEVFADHVNLAKAQRQVKLFSWLG